MSILTVAWRIIDGFFDLRVELSGVCVCSYALLVVLRHRAALQV